MIFTPPYKGAYPSLISQGYHSKHKALDMVVFGSDNGWGTPLVAPEDCQVVKIYNALNSDLKNGYGIFLYGIETQKVHQYWHTWSACPVDEGEYVKRGQIVAFMGNAGNVFMGGKYVPLDERYTPTKKGTHLHWEYMDSYKPGKKGTHRDQTKLIDWTLKPTYTAFDHLKAISRTLVKLSKRLV